MKFGVGNEVQEKCGLFSGFSLCDLCEPWLLETQNYIRSWIFWYNLQMVISMSEYLERMMGRVILQ